MKGHFEVRSGKAVHAGRLVRLVDIPIERGIITDMGLHMPQRTQAD